MNLVYPLLKPPLLSNTSAYSFVEARAVAMKLTEVVQTLLTWIRVCLVDAAPGIDSLGTFDLEDCLARGRRKTLRDIVPEALPLQQAKTTYVMQSAPSAPTPLAPSKKSFTPANSWELQKLALCRICNVSGLYPPPKYM